MYGLFLYFYIQKFIRVLRDFDYDVIFEYSCHYVLNSNDVISIFGHLFPKSDTSQPVLCFC